MLVTEAGTGFTVAYGPKPSAPQHQSVPSYFTAQLVDSYTEIHLTPALHVRPSPSQPVWQAQVNDPVVFVQLA